MKGDLAARSGAGKGSARLAAMFDFRYHVASLAAVFLALVIGILVGLGLSGRGFIDDAERRNLNDRIDALSADRDAAREQLAASTRRQAAMEDYAEDTYPLLVPGRLEGLDVAILFVGALGDPLDTVTEAVRRAGGRVARIRAIRVPLQPQAVREALARTPVLQRRYGAADALDDLGRDLGHELAAGGKTPLWDALDGVLVEEREGSSVRAADAVVVARRVRPQQGVTKDFLAGLYRGLGRSGVPAVGVEVAAPETSAISAFARNGLSTVDSVDTAAGRLALVLLLAGPAEGNYGVDETATDGVLPPIPALPTGR
jgi:outer membrane murein-binding lipoprotein Lpp